MPPSSLATRSTRRPMSRTRPTATPNGRSNSSPQRLQHRLHHLVRLHGSDDQGREEISRREVRTRDGLQACAQRFDLRRQILRRAVCDGADRRQDDQVGRDRVYRFVSDPEVVSGIDAFERGLATTNPNAKSKIDWVNTWFDPGKEADAAKALIAQGADVLNPAHRLGRAAAGGGEGRRARLRPIVRHGAVRRQHRQLGSVLHPAHPGGDRRDVEIGGHLGRHRQGHGRACAVRQHARRRQGDGRKDHRRHRLRGAADFLPARCSTRTAGTAASRETRRCRTAISCR